MAIKHLLHFIIIFPLMIILCPALLYAEKKEDKSEPKEPETLNSEDDIFNKDLKPGEIFSCETDIFYEYTEKSTENDQKKNSKEFVETLVQRGNDGRLCKSELENRLNDAKNNALNLCKKNYDVSSCTTNKLTAAKNDLRELDFQTKRTLTSSIIQSCEEKTAKCESATNTDIKCFIYKSPESSAKKDDSSQTTESSAKK